MKKELKNYLHFYLGCKCKGKSGTMIYTLIDVGLERSSLLLDKFGNECVIFDFKPILRPLSDMTEEEQLQFDEIYEDMMIGYTIEDKKEAIKFQTENEASKIKFLLSKHFDLFGLIEAGLAIDATTIKADSLPLGSKGFYDQAN